MKCTIDLRSLSGKELEMSWFLVGKVINNLHDGTVVGCMCSSSHNPAYLAEFKGS